MPRSLLYIDFGPLIGFTVFSSALVGGGIIFAATKYAYAESTASMKEDKGLTNDLEKPKDPIKDLKKPKYQTAFNTSRKSLMKKFLPLKKLPQTKKNFLPFLVLIPLTQYANSK